MEKGHYGEYSGNARHSRVTASNYKATERDDAAHIDYLKRDINYDAKHGHSNIDMTADEKHISKLAGDMKYDKRHHGMSRKENRQEQHLRTQVENYPKPMPANAPTTYMRSAPKRLVQSYRSEGNTGWPTPEYVQGKYEDYMGYDSENPNAPGFSARDLAPSRKSKSDRLRERAMKRSERTGAESGDYDYEDEKVQKLLEKARMAERTGDMKMTKEMTTKPKMKANEYIEEERDRELNKMMDERDGMSRMSKWGGNMHDYHRHMDAQGHMTKDGVVGGGKYGKGGHYKDYEGMSRDSYGMDRKSCGTKYTGVGRYSSALLNTGWSGFNYNKASAELDYMPIEHDMKRGMSRKGSKPDYIDIDGDGNTKEPMKQAADGMSRLASPLNAKGDKCPESGCVQEKGNGKWGVISGKTGKWWDANYDSKDSAEAGLRAYFAKGGN